MTRTGWISCRTPPMADRPGTYEVCFALPMGPHIERRDWTGKSWAAPEKCWEAYDWLPPSRKWGDKWRGVEKK